MLGLRQLDGGNSINDDSGLGRLIVIDVLTCPVLVTVTFGSRISTKINKDRRPYLKFTIAVSPSSIISFKVS